MSFNKAKKFAKKKLQKEIAEIPEKLAEEVIEVGTPAPEAPKVEDSAERIAYEEMQKASLQAAQGVFMSAQEQMTAKGWYVCARFSSLPGRPEVAVSQVMIEPIPYDAFQKLEAKKNATPEPTPDHSPTAETPANTPENGGTVPGEGEGIKD